MPFPPTGISPPSPDSVIQNLFGYNLRNELDGHPFPDIEVGRHRLNRGLAAPNTALPTALQARADAEWRSALFPPPPGSAVRELGYPSAGVFFASSSGQHLDPRAGVGQLFDRHHPRLQEVRSEMRRLDLDSSFLTGAILRNADIEEICTPPDLAASYNSLAATAFPALGGFKSALVGSAPEAVGRGLQLLYAHASKRLTAIVAPKVLDRLVRQLGLPPFPGAPTIPPPLPFSVLVAGAYAA